MVTWIKWKKNPQGTEYRLCQVENGFAGLGQECHESKSFIRKKKICGITNDPGIDAQRVALLAQTKQNEAKNAERLFVINSVAVIKKK